MNHMKQVAHMLGLEIGEEFNVKGCIDDFRFKFTEEDMGYFCNDTWVSMSCFIGDILRGKYEIVKLLLTKEEKEYLSMVIKPFRDKMRYIYKFPYSDGRSEYLVGVTEDAGYLELPRFEKRSMYKGMELSKKYTLEELGL